MIGARLSHDLPVARRVLATTATVEPDIALVTVPNVELLEVGENWECATGTFTWSTADLQSAIAALADPFVRTPVIKLGHVDSRFDGQPALGRIENLRTTNNGQTLVGDLVGVPMWLGQCMASAFPARSIEGWFDYTTRTGNTWPFVLTGLALLGDAYPAIESLEDVQALFGKEPPVLVPVGDNPQVVAEAASGPRVAIPASHPGLVLASTTPPAEPADPPADPPTPGEGRPTGVSASVSYNDIITAFYDGPGDEPGRYWWWIREVLADPDELIVDDDEGHLYRVPYTIGSGDGAAALTFGDPQEVRIQYVDVAAARSSMKFGNPVAAGRPRARRVTGAADPTPQPREVPDVQLTEEQLKALGLEADATDEQISEALTAKLTTPAPPAPPAPEAQPPTGEGGGEPQPPAPTPAPTPTGEQPPATPPASLEIPEGMTLIDAQALTDLREGVAAARRIEAASVKAERNRLLDDAVKAGKFPKARREHYETLLTADPEGTKELIGRMAENVIPVEERGYGGSEEPDEVHAGGPAYPDAWKTTVAAARRSTGSRIKVVTD